MNNLPISVKQDIKSTIEKMTCPRCGKSPQITFHNEGFSVSCCCKEFEEATLKTCEKAVGDAYSAYIDRSLRGLL